MKSFIVYSVKCIFGRLICSNFYRSRDKNGGSMDGRYLKKRRPTSFTDLEHLRKKYGFSFLSLYYMMLNYFTINTIRRRE